MLTSRVRLDEGVVPPRDRSTTGQYQAQTASTAPQTTWGSLGPRLTWTGPGPRGRGGPTHSTNSQHPGMGKPVSDGYEMLTFWL